MFRIDIEKNPRVKRKLQALLGSAADLSKLAVFEALANDSLPIGGAGGFFKQARMTKEYLAEMASKVQDGQYVPIIELHDQHGSLPIGRIFDAAVFDSSAAEGESDLHVLFYVNSDSEHAQNIETGILAEISTGSTPAALKCSACNYDFMASADNRRNLYKGKDYTPLCPDGHQWGVGGNHLKLSKVQSWKEMSVVTRGAVERAHILGTSEQKLALATKEISLAAHEEDDTLLLVTLEGASHTGKVPANISNSGEKNTMTQVTLEQEDYKALLLAEAQKEQFELKLQTAEEAKNKAEADKAAAETAKADAEAQLSAKDQELEAANAKVVELEAKLAAATTGAGNKGKGVEEGGEQDSVNLSSLDTSYFKATQ